MACVASQCSGWGRPGTCLFERDLPCIKEMLSFTADPPEALTSAAHLAHPGLLSSERGRAMMLFAWVLTELSGAQATLGLLENAARGLGRAGLTPNVPVHFGVLERPWQEVGPCGDRFPQRGTGCPSTRHRHGLGHRDCHTRASPFLDIWHRCGYPSFLSGYNTGRSPCCVSPWG